MEDKSQKKCPPKIVVLNNSLKLAEEWVKNMTESADDVQIKAEGRPHRLGLGAKVSHQTKIGPFHDPLERKLYAKLDRQKKRAEELATDSKKDKNRDDSDDSDDTESRTHAFDKKRVPANQMATPVPAKKKKK